MHFWTMLDIPIFVLNVQQDLGCLSRREPHSWSCTLPQSVSSPWSLSWDQYNLSKFDACWRYCTATANHLSLSLVNSSSPINRRASRWCSGSAAHPSAREETTCPYPFSTIMIEVFIHQQNDERLCETLIACSTNPYRQYCSPEQWNIVHLGFCRHPFEGDSRRGAELRQRDGRLSHHRGGPLPQLRPLRRRWTSHPRS